MIDWHQLGMLAGVASGYAFGLPIAYRLGEKVVPTGEDELATLIAITWPVVLPVIAITILPFKTGAAIADWVEEKCKRP